MIDLSIHFEALARSVSLAREKNIIIPTFKQQKNPRKIPAAIQNRLKTVGLWDLDPLNLFRITWHNEPLAHGGGFGDVNFVEFPQALTGVDATIIGIVGNPDGPAWIAGIGFSVLVWYTLNIRQTIEVFLADMFATPEPDIELAEPRPRG